MTVTFLPATEQIHDEAVRQNFEWIENHGLFDGSGLALLLATAGKRAVAFGDVVFTFTAAAASAAQTVTTGIGRSPRVWLQNSSGANFFDAVISAVTATSFTAHAYQTQGTVVSTAVQFWWVAIG